MNYVWVTFKVGVTLGVLVVGAVAIGTTVFAEETVCRKYKKEEKCETKERKWLNISTKPISIEATSTPQPVRRSRTNFYEYSSSEESLEEEYYTDHMPYKTCIEYVCQRLQDFENKSMSASMLGAELRERDLLEDKLKSWVCSQPQLVWKHTKTECTVSLDVCDCGRPYLRKEGVHVCRYYGHFRCRGCGNQWTSAWAWKGKSQSCKKCDKKSFPWKKEPLQRGLGSDIKGPHDSKRCGMCAQLGRDCSTI